MVRAAFVLSLSLIAVWASAADRVRLRAGRAVAGSITAVTPEGVRVETPSGQREVPLEEIKLVTFEDEPPGLTQARLNVNALGYRTALERLERIDPAGLSDELVRQDVQYYTAFCRARLAIAGAGDPKAAEKGLADFVRGARQSYHYYGAVQTLGDLMVAGERHSRAEKFYALLAKAKAPSLRVRARVLAGQVSRAKGKHDEAIRRFDAALALKLSGDTPSAEHRSARIGKAESLAAKGDLAAARRLVATVVGSLAEDDSAAQAAAYNALGRIHQAADDTTGALLAYLHTDLLFNEDAATHAEALARLGPLWRESGDAEASRDAAERLRRRYPTSRWARLAGQAK